MQADFLIVGAGLIGMLVARELRAGGATVTVIERGAVGRESSWAGGGILSPLYPWRYPRTVTALARWSQQAYPELCAALAAESGVDPEWTQSGLLILDVHDSEVARDWAAQYGMRMEAPDAAALKTLHPVLLETGKAVWMPDIAQVRNPRLVQALRASLINGGVTLQEGVEVRALQIEQGRIAGVRTAQGTLTAGHVIVAGGAWSAGLLRTAGVALPVTPVRGQMLLFRASPGLLARMVMRHHRYLIPRRDGHILAGSTLEQVGFDKATTAQAATDLQRAAFDLLPALTECPMERHWAGLRPGTPTGVPSIGPCSLLPGLYVCTGHYRNGVVLGPASARLLADLALGRSPILEPTPYQFPPEA